MKLQIVSDLHLEFSPVDIKNAGADVLILSGDILKADNLHRLHQRQDRHPDQPIGSDFSAIQLGLEFRRFLSQCSERFSHVIYVAGNHEFYHGHFYDSVDHIRQEITRYPNIHFLENNSVEIDSVLFLGATVWTNCHNSNPLVLNGLSDMLNDFRLIRNDHTGYTRLRPAHTVGRHNETLEYFKKTLAEHKHDRVVVVGHHAPSYLSIHEKYRDDFVANGGYASDLSEFILDHPEIVLWTHGHTHTPFDYVIGDTRVICNPRGYEGHGEVSGWNPDLVVEI